MQIEVKEGRRPVLFPNVPPGMNPDMDYSSHPTTLLFAKHTTKFMKFKLDLVVERPCLHSGRRYKPGHAA